MHRAIFHRSLTFRKSNFPLFSSTFHSISSCNNTHTVPLSAIHHSSNNSHSFRCLSTSSVTENVEQLNLENISNFDISSVDDDSQWDSFSFGEVFLCEKGIIQVDQLHTAKIGDLIYFIRQSDEDEEFDEENFHPEKPTSTFITSSPYISRGIVLSLHEDHCKIIIMEEVEEEVEEEQESGEHSQLNDSEIVSAEELLPDIEEELETESAVISTFSDTNTAAVCGSEAPIAPSLTDDEPVYTGPDMKHLYWDPLSPQRLEQTLWAEMNELGFDQEQFVQLFQAKAIADVKKSNKQTTKQSFVAERKSQNIEIVLSRWKTSAETIRDSLLLIDFKLLTLDRVKILQSIWPAVEETQVALNYSGDYKSLSPAEKFYVLIAPYPRLSQRLQCLEFRLSFDETVMSIQTKLNILSSASNEIRNSRCLKRVLESLLTIGNFMNAGMKKPKAKGFRLEILEKLELTKSTSEDLTLLDYLVDYCSSRFSIDGNLIDSDADLKSEFSISFLHELHNVDEAAKISIQELEMEIQDLEMKLKILREQLQMPQIQIATQTESKK